MKHVGLALRSVRASSLRSGIVLLASAALTGLGAASFLILSGVRTSLENAVARLGADVIVVPRGATRGIETALLMGVATGIAMPSAMLSSVRRIPGVVRASPQLHLSTLKASSCCSRSEMFLVAYDPPTDFTIRAWLDEPLPNGLQRGEAIGGQYVFEPPDGLLVYGTPLKLRANLAATGTGLDQALFLTFDTALEIARQSREIAEAPLTIAPDTVSAVMVAVEPSFSAIATAARIEAALPEVSAVASPRLFEFHRDQFRTLEVVLGAATVSTILVAFIVMGFVFGMASHERRREIGIMRALGATRVFVLGVTVLEAAGLGLSGSVAGCALVLPAFFLFRRALILFLGLPIALPSGMNLVATTAATLLTGTLSALVASSVLLIGACRVEPATAMRETA